MQVEAKGKIFDLEEENINFLPPLFRFAIRESVRSVDVRSVFAVWRGTQHLGYVYYQTRGWNLVLSDTRRFPLNVDSLLGAIEALNALWEEYVNCKVNA